MPEITSSHFKDKDAAAHLAEVKVQGLLASTEAHGVEVPGHISAAMDASKESAVILLLLWCILTFLSIPPSVMLLLLAIFSTGLLFWRAGRSALLGWARLERLHRVLEQERWEIQHNRQQEREELYALYGSKGLTGDLLEQVINVLMADDNRLLKIMIEEELGLSLETHEHPLKQGVVAGLGSLIASLVCLAGLILYPPLGLVIAGFLVIGFSAGYIAYYASNQVIPAVVWNIGSLALALGCVYLFLKYAASS